MENNDKQSDRLAKLPPETLRQIFSYLTSKQLIQMKWPSEAYKPHVESIIARRIQSAVQGIMHTPNLSEKEIKERIIENAKNNLRFALVAICYTPSFKKLVPFHQIPSEKSILDIIAIVEAHDEETKKKLINLALYKCLDQRYLEESDILTKEYDAQYNQQQVNRLFMEYLEDLDFEYAGILRDKYAAEDKEGVNRLYKKWLEQGYLEDTEILREEFGAQLTSDQLDESQSRARSAFIL